MEKEKLFTTDDGWDCIPELKEFVTTIEEMGHFVYEIKNCVRVSDLEDMVYDLKLQLDEAKEVLNEIDTNVEIIQEEL